MALTISYDPSQASAVVRAGDDVPEAAWNRIKQASVAVDSQAVVKGRELTIPWYSFLASARDYAVVRKQFGLQFEQSEQAARLLSEHAADVRAAKAAEANVSSLSPSEVDENLKSTGFDKRNLTDKQLDSVARLLSLRNGANFSVPGAGKTTVALAVHHLLELDKKVLLVVAPKNAFSAWDEALTDCYGDVTASQEPFIRLVGGAEAIRQLLRSGARRFIIGYDQLSVVQGLVATFFATQPVHLILDESHRIKAGIATLRGSAALRIAPLAKRRDILSGTPVPNGIQDIAPQFDFLWTGLQLGSKAAAASNPRSVLSPYYVRVTKDQLGLPPVRREFIRVDMSEPQLALYALLRSAAIRRISMMREGKADFTAARGSAMRLLQASANPSAAVAAIQAGSDIDHGDDALLPIYDAVLSAGPSPKMLKTREIVDGLSSVGRKTVIWTVFRKTIDDLELLLEDFHPAVIHGGIGAGESDDLSTREGRLRLFHDDDACRVLIANPAACSEGISLHKVCHDALYVDRTYNAAHYLQSVDRIHRLGLAADVVTKVTILLSSVPQGIGSIDYSVSRRMKVKLEAMNALLDDPDLRRLALDEDEAEEDIIDSGTDIEDLYDLIARLLDDPPFDESEAE